MAKRKQKKTTSAQSSDALRRNGLQAFKRRDYSTAIAVWERAYKQRPDGQTAVALAEAHFRRGVSALGGSEAALADLQRAHQLQPDDDCYAYHLALTLHRQGRPSEAQPLYQNIYQGKSPFAKRAAYPLALALLQQGENPANHPVWSALSEAEQTMLQFGLSPQQVAADEGSPFWQGILALQNGRYTQADDLLRQTLDKPESLLQQAAAHYALGLIAAQTEDWRAARRHWQTAYNSGFHAAQLRHNLRELYHRLAEERLQADDLSAALNAAQETAKLYEERPSALAELESQIYQRLGQQAASAGKWDEALGHWQQARDLDGSSFRLAYNFALGLEKQEDFVAAGEAWREALRRRPRRSDHPDAITDEQVSRLWRRAAEAYQKAGDFDDAIQVYRHAVKWQENNLEVRLALAESLMANGQLQAADNELERILAKDRNYIPALLQRGEVFASYEDWRSLQAIHLWNRVLEVEPANQQAKRLLTDFYLNRAEIALSWDQVDRAIESYQKALEYMPQSPPILAALGSCYLFMDDPDTANKYIEEAIARAPADLSVYAPVLRAWLEMEEPEEAEQMFARMQTAVSYIPYQFYMNLVVHCLEYGATDLIEPWLERAVAAAPPAENILLMIGEMLMFIGDPEMARRYLERAIEVGQQPAEAYFTLGMVAMRQGNRKLADQHWQQASRLARRERNQELLERIREAKDMFDSPLGMLLSMSGQGDMPSLFELTRMLAEDLGGEWEDDEWEDDDDGYF
ncbi:MAG: tetratricopeptide repeat protein [Chloroflexota bacterium]